MTTAVYLQDPYLYTGSAEVVEVVCNADGNHTVILNQTIFYPQGGGQPSDQGVISSGDAEFLVKKVLKDRSSGLINHIGSFQSNDRQFKPKDLVNIIVNQERRLLNARYHTAGHVIDLALMGRLNGVDDWESGSGNHDPMGAYVEYKARGDITNIKEGLINDIEVTVKELITIGLKSQCRLIKDHSLIPKASMSMISPDMLKLPDGIRMHRVEGFDEYWIPCGGTLVSNLNEIGMFKITKHSFKKGLLRICYQLA